MDMKENIIAEKSKDLALRMIKLFMLLKAYEKEALAGQSKKDFCAKMNIALKEISETEYFWLEFLLESGFLSTQQFDSIYDDCQEAIKLLVSITKTMKPEAEKTKHED